MPNKCNFAGSYLLEADRVAIEKTSLSQSLIHRKAIGAGSGGGSLHLPCTCDGLIFLLSSQSCTKGLSTSVQHHRAHEPLTPLDSGGNALPLLASRDRVGILGEKSPRASYASHLHLPCSPTGYNTFTLKAMTCSRWWVLVCESYGTTVQRCHLGVTSLIVGAIGCVNLVSKGSAFSLL